MRRKLIAGAVLLLAFVPVPARAAQHTVNYSDSAFSPASIRIAVNDDVFWCANPGNEKAHSITADDGSFTRDVPPNSGCTWLTFQESGSFPYHCKFVAGMTGTINVGGGAPAPVTSAPKPVATTVTTASAARATATTAVSRSSTTSRATATTVRSSSTTAARPIAVVIDDTSTTAGQVAIREEKTSSSGQGSNTLVAVGVVAGIAVGAAYVYFRGRHLRLNQWS